MEYELKRKAKKNDGCTGLPGKLIGQGRGSGQDGEKEAPGDEQQGEYVPLPTVWFWHDPAHRPLTDGAESKHNPCFIPAPRALSPPPQGKATSRSQRACSNPIRDKNPAGQ